ncbi:MAG: hypothetical protein FWD05_06700 [Oscillospiraceae bacterium]|nr:hypothetical protein [Oscillospiraceae bacterium]
MKSININKTKLHRIVAEHILLPQLKQTRFEKTPCHLKYFLKWTAENGNDSEACLSFCDNNRPVLTIDVHDNKNDVMKNLIRIVWNDWKEISDFIPLI